MKHKNDVMNSYLNSFVTWLSGSYSWLTCHILLPVQLPGFTLTVVQRNDIDLPDMELKGNVLVYSITGCPHCMKAKNTLQENNIPYTDINLDTFPQCREDVKTRTGRSTVPQIFFNATHVGGNDDLVNLVSKEQGYYFIIAQRSSRCPYTLLLIELQTPVILLTFCHLYHNFNTILSLELLCIIYPWSYFARWFGNAFIFHCSCSDLAQ
jgi:glutaredoxin